MTDLSQAIWRKARRSAHNGGCVEIAANLDGVAAVRDSKRPEEGPLRPGVVGVPTKGPPADAAIGGPFLRSACLEA
ncbi:MAG: DUF397 domain-containing protein [Streptosporangiaceae bacterium]